LNADLPDLRLHLSAGEGDLDPRRPGWTPAGVRRAAVAGGHAGVELASERIGPVMSPRFAGYERLKEAPASACCSEAVLHTTSRPQAWPAGQSSGLDVKALKHGQGFEHLYYLLEAAVAGLGVAIAPQPLVAEDLKAGRLVAPWGFSETPAHWHCGCPSAPRTGAPGNWRNGSRRAAPDKLVTAFAQQVGGQQTQCANGDTGGGQGCSWA
jgi:DNA-binding transcriptional LysR family regulator